MKSILVSIIAVLAVMTLISVNASAGELASDLQVRINGVDIEQEVLGIEAGETLPVKVVFTAAKDASDVVVRASVEGFRNDITDKTGRFEILNGDTYIKYLSLTIPSDLDELTEEITLNIRISNVAQSDEQEFSLELQRESYKLNILSVEAPQEAAAGTTLPVDVVLKNFGMSKLEDVFVKVRIPALGIEKKVYFGDISPLDEDEYSSDVRYANREDSIERRIYISVPESAKSGVYSLEVEAFNLDSSEIVKKSIVISGAEGTSRVIASTGAKTIAIGQEATYDLIIVNSGNKAKVFTLTAEDAPGLIVETDSIVTVQAGSSKTVQVGVKATSSAEEGTHTVLIDVESEGAIVKQASLTANVEKTGVATTNSVVILTVILVIVFVVLLIILIVLLTRKPATSETEETSYY